LGGRGYWPTRSFEYLAACKHNEMTHPPGPKSFTRALIWAMETLVKTRKEFSTHELQVQIGKAPKFPKIQQVEVFDRGEPFYQRLVLAPLPQPHSMGLNSANGHVAERKPQNFFDLRFWYSDDIDEAEVEEVANIFKKLILDKKIGANRIAWIRYDVVQHLKSIVDKWRRLPSRKSMSKSPGLNLDIPQLFDHGLHLSPLTPPSSHSGAYRIVKDEPTIEQGSAPPAETLPTNLVNSEIDGGRVCNHYSRAMQVDLPTNYLPTTLTITGGSRWLQPGVLAFGLLSYFCLRKYQN